MTPLSLVPLRGGHWRPTPKAAFPSPGRTWPQLVSSQPGHLCWSSYPSLFSLTSYLCWAPPPKLPAELPLLHSPIPLQGMKVLLHLMKSLSPPTILGSSAPPGSTPLLYGHGNVSRGLSSLTSGCPTRSYRHLHLLEGENGSGRLSDLPQAFSKRDSAGLESRATA